MPDGPRLVVTPEYELAAVCERLAPERVVAFGSPERPPKRPEAAASWREILFHDIPEPRPGFQAATERDVDAIIAEGRAWTGERPLVLQCWMGISRSTAAALLVACARGTNPSDAAATLRALAPEATPNPHVVALADRALALNGALREAAAAIGRGREAPHGRAFEWVLPR